MPCCLCTHCSLFLRCLSHLVHLANSYPLIKTQLRYPHLAFPFLTCAPTHSLCVPSQAPSHKHTLRSIHADTVPCAGDCAVTNPVPASWSRRPGWEDRLCPRSQTNATARLRGVGSGCTEKGPRKATSHQQPQLGSGATSLVSRPPRRRGLSQVSTGTWEPLTRSASPHPPPHLKITCVKKKR